MADGSIEFSTKLDNSELEKGLKDASREIDDLKRKIEEKTSERNAIAEELVEVRKRIAEAEEAQRDCNDELERGVELSKQYYDVQAEIDGYTSRLAELTAAQREFGEEYAKSYRKGAAGFEGALGSMEKRFDAFASKIGKRMKKLFVFAFIFKALSTMKEYMLGVIEEDERFKASAENLAATLRGIAEPIVKAIIPALTAVVNVLSAMLMTLAKLADGIFRTDFAGSISRARETARQNAEATDEETKATDKLAKSKKKAARELMAFDELNVLGAENAQEVAAATAPETDVNPEPVNWDALDVGKIDAKLAEIMMIAGAALLAVGAILAFSGINIPLGITLMAIGALMVYTAVQEQWDKLPKEVQDAINTAIVVTAIVLIVLGAVLAFSGAALPLGIGMILAGATLLYLEAALNWDKLSDETKDAITKVMVAVGSALIAVGAILALSGANIPLGVGLMIAGAASLATAAVLNWNELSDEVKGKIVTIESIVGTAFIAIGAILALSGANIPLGMMLIVLGAASLVMAAAISWNELPDDVRQAITKILAIIGVALIVIGVILLVTGVGIPIGVACILAGAASLVTAAAINWDFLKEKVRSIWDGIVRWFEQNVAPIFTAEWWAEKFKCIVNGLIDVLNSGLGAADWFANGVLGKISELAGFVGIDLGFEPVQSLRIPHLAQGAVIPPNREFMAVLGDQTRGTNIEAPEDLIRKIVREEAGGQLTGILYELLDAVREGKNIYVDRQVLGRTAVREQASMAVMGGR